ncbi:MAG: elongation factor 4, partial [Candidatus Omnitrophica bacterium]|nr:elongation factor 4 [Candidatus Omnitrophota bacterium]
DLERERGITIKASHVRLHYTASDQQRYTLNLIDTPGHVDFSFEVTKSLKACEGALLVVDAAQGVEAQTVANLHLALAQHLAIIPVINKIDLAQAQPEQVARELRQLLGQPHQEVILASAKTGQGTEEILEHIVHDIDPPRGASDAPLQGLIFDSHYDVYKGVVVFVRIMQGTLRPGMTIQFMGTRQSFEVLELGVMTPRVTALEQLGPGEVGFMACQIRDPQDVVAGDTVTEMRRPAAQPLPGFQRLHPFVFAGVYPSSTADFVHLREALEKLTLSDASFSWEPESSDALGPGFRCGFLGLLHMEIIQERLEREYDQSLVITTPSVVFRVRRHDGTLHDVERPSELPSSGEILEIQEPYARVTVIAPVSYLGAIMEFVKERRGLYRSTQSLSEERVSLTLELPLAELIVDFNDRLKSMTRGYGSLDYELIGYRPAQLVKLDLLLNGALCDPLSSLVHKAKAYEKGRALVAKLQELIPRQLFEVAVQAAVGSHVIARETIRPIGKAATARCSGGDITRKRKLWEKQKEGKKRMKQFGQVEIPQEAFLAALKI